MGKNKKGIEFDQSEWLSSQLQSFLKGLPIQAKYFRLEMSDNLFLVQFEPRSEGEAAAERKNKSWKSKVAKRPVYEEDFDEDDEESI